MRNSVFRLRHNRTDCWVEPGIKGTTASIGEAHRVDRKHRNARAAGVQQGAAPTEADVAPLQHDGLCYYFCMPKAVSTQSISSLPNLGPKSQEMLAAAGITQVAQLRKMGSVAAYVRVKSKVPGATLNLLWALEGALTGLPWQQVAKEHRTSLLLSLERAQRDG